MTKGARERTGDDMEIIASRCRRRSGRRLRRKRLKRRKGELSEKSSDQMEIEEYMFTKCDSSYA